MTDDLLNSHILMDMDSLNEARYKAYVNLKEPIVKTTKIGDIEKKEIITKRRATSEDFSMDKVRAAWAKKTPEEKREIKNKINNMLDVHQFKRILKKEGCTEIVYNPETKFTEYKLSPIKTIGGKEKPRTLYVGDHTSQTHMLQDRCNIYINKKDIRDRRNVTLRHEIEHSKGAAPFISRDKDTKKFYANFDLKTAATYLSKKLNIDIRLLSNPKNLLYLLNTSHFNAYEAMADHAAGGFGQMLNGLNYKVNSRYFNESGKKKSLYIAKHIDDDPVHAMAVLFKPTDFVENTPNPKDEAEKMNKLKREYVSDYQLRKRSDKILSNAEKKKKK